MIRIKEYVKLDGNSPFTRWFLDLNAIAAAKITKALYKLEIGNFSTVEGVGNGVYEQKIDFGPGYRIYFGKECNEIIILLCGGSKKRQSNDIAQAKEYWLDYKRRKNKRYLCP
jgi:putative addiction module killer protein